MRARTRGKRVQVLLIATKQGYDMKRSKLLLAVVGAATLLGALVSSSSARNLSHTSQTFTAAWARMDFTASLGTVECEVTLGGSLSSRTYAKTGSTVGYITEARIRSPCRRGEATILTETLPWEVQYESFIGSLPNITSIRLRVIGFAWRFGLFGISCLMRSEVGHTVALTLNREAGGRITSLVIGGRIPTTGCGEGMLAGTSNTVTANTVILI